MTRRQVIALSATIGLLLMAVMLSAVVFATDEIGGKITGVAAVVGVFVVLVPPAWRSFQSGTSVSEEAVLETAAGGLARSVSRRWTKEATQRGITAPATVRVTWRRAPSPPGTARPHKGARPRELRPEAGRLLDAGMLGDLHELYGDPEVDKVVILGKAGAGKSGVLIQLLLEALRERERSPAGDRYDIPVPVLLALGDWDPTSAGLVEWADGVLRRDYGRAATAAGASVYRELLEDGRIALFLDGLDEMPARFWQAAADAIQQTTHLRVVLTGRPEVGQDAHIAFAARITLDPVSVQEAADYLRSARRPGVHPEQWEVLIDHLLRQPAERSGQGPLDALDAVAGPEHVRPARRGPVHPAVRAAFGTLRASRASSSRGSCRSPTSPRAPWPAGREATRRTPRSATCASSPSGCASVAGAISPGGTSGIGLPPSHRP